MTQDTVLPGLDSLDRTFVECSALGFQSVVTSILALACYAIYQRHRGPIS
jgi:hypothetical protein